MPAAYTTITLDGGPSTVSLVDPDNFQLQENGYMIISPRRLLAGKAGALPYAIVEGEEVRINLYGSTGAVLLANKTDLEEILDQAARWKRGDPVNAILLKILAQGSAFASALQSVIYGGELILPDQFFDKLMVNAIEGVTIKWDRLPAFLGGEEVAGPTTAANVPNIMSLTFVANPKIASPVELLIDGFSGAAITDNWLLTAENAADLTIVEAEAAVDNTAAGTWNSSKADAGKNPRGGLLGGYTAGDTNWNYVSFISLGISGKDVTVFGAVRQNNSARTWQLKADSLSLSGGIVNGETRPITLDYNSGNPQIVNFGTITSALNNHEVINIYFKVDSTTGPPTLDFDYFVFMVRDGDCNQAIHVIPSANLSGDFALRFDHRLLERPTPAVLFEVGANISPMGYDSPPIVLSKGTNLSAVWLACYDNQWVHTPTSKAAPSQITITGTRRIAYPSPE